jgi:hypothetical protein
VNRRGAALVGAVLALVCLSALLVGAAFTGREAYLLTAANAEGQSAFAAAEHGVWAGVAAIDASDAVAAVGTVRSVSIRHGSGARSAVTITRLSGGLFFVVSEGISGALGPRRSARRVGVFALAQSDSTGRISALPLGEGAWSELP